MQGQEDGDIHGVLHQAASKRIRAKQSMASAVVSKSVDHLFGHGGKGRDVDGLTGLEMANELALEFARFLIEPTDLELRPSPLPI